MKKLFLNITLALCALISFSACNNDGDTIYLNGFGSSDLVATTSDVVLSISNSNSIVLSLAWKNPALLSSDSTKTAVDGLLKTYLQISTTEDFASYSEYTVTTLSKAYTGDALNNLAKTMGMKSDIATPLYFRIKGSEGSNIEPAYSNVCKVNVTPFTIHMNSLSVLSKDKSDTVATLYSPTENGTYTGFMKASSWFNCWFAENDGTIWGNYAQSGHQFELSKASDAWNCWFAEGAGHWYVTVDTKNAVWSATNITSMNLNGKAMTYNSDKSTWTYVVTTTSANEEIAITADGLEYNTTTKDSKDAAIAQKLYFTMANGAMELATAAKSATIAKAGTYTVTVSIGNNAQYNYTIAEGNTTTETSAKLPTKLYMYSTDGSTELATMTATSTGIYTCDYAPKIWENFKFFDQENNILYGNDPGDLFTLSNQKSCYNIWFKDDFTSGATLTVTANLNTKKWSYSIK